jgi:type I site-specific restriction endonuclease
VKLPKLSFPVYEFKIQAAVSPGQSLKIFDIIRKKYVTLTPEEWVRQHLLHFLVNERKFPQSLLSVEKKVLVNRLGKRTDIVAYSSSLKPIMIAECKAPSVSLKQMAFDQAARYNMSFGVFYFIITNGLETHCCILDKDSQTYRFLTEIPSYEEIKL